MEIGRTGVVRADIWRRKVAKGVRDCDDLLEGLLASAARGHPSLKFDPPSLSDCSNRDSGRLIKDRLLAGVPPSSDGEEEFCPMTG